MYLLFSEKNTNSFCVDDEIERIKDIWNGQNSDYWFTKCISIECYRQF